MERIDLPHPSVAMKVVRRCMKRKELSAFLSCMRVRKLLKAKKFDEYTAFGGSLRKGRWPFPGGAHGMQKLHIVVLRAHKGLPQRPNSRIHKITLLSIPQ